MGSLDQKLSPELACLAAMRQARADFYDRVVKTAEDWREQSGDKGLTREERKHLRSDGVAQIAEFFFVFRDGNLNSREGIKSFLHSHNEDMGALLEGCEKGYTRFGLSAARLKEAMFKPHQIELILHESAAGPLTFDQRSIGKILTQVMSFESCRTILVLLASCGHLTRRDFRSVVLISSNGRLEDLYGDYLRSILGAFPNKGE